MLAHADLRLSGSEGAADATLAAVRSLALCARLVRGLLVSFMPVSQSLLKSDSLLEYNAGCHGDPPGSLLAPGARLAFVCHSALHKHKRTFERSWGAAAGRHERLALSPAPGAEPGHLRGRR